MGDGRTDDITSAIMDLDLAEPSSINNTSPTTPTGLRKIRYWLRHVKSTTTRTRRRSRCRHLAHREATVMNGPWLSRRPVEATTLNVTMNVMVLFPSNPFLQAMAMKSMMRLWLYSNLDRERTPSPRHSHSVEPGERSRSREGVRGTQPPYGREPASSAEGPCLSPRRLQRCSG